MASSTLIVLISLFSFFAGCLCRTDIQIIDDGDIGPFPVNTARLASIAFYPSKNGMWGSQSGGARTTALKPVADKAHSQTWTATSKFSGNTPRSIVIDFFGTSITAFFTLSNDLPTECDVTLDDGLEFKVRHAAGSRSEDVSYKVPVISYKNLTSDIHRMEIKVTPFNPDRINYVNFDYAEYTYNVEDATEFSQRSSRLNSVKPDAASQGKMESVPAHPRNIQVAAIAGGSIGGSIIIAAIILVLYFRSRGQKRDISSIEAKVDISGHPSNSKPSMFQRFTFHRRFGSLMVKTPPKNDMSPQGLPAMSYSGRYSTSSSESDVSSKAQPMYQEFGHAAKWDDLTTIASTPQTHKISSFTPSPAQVSAPKVVEGRRKYDDNRLDSLGLHLTTIKTPVIKKAHIRDGSSTSTGDDASASRGGSSRDLTAPYQYSIRQPPV